MSAVALCIAIGNSNSSERWENSQINALNNLGSNSVAQKEELINLNKRLELIEAHQLADISNNLKNIEKNTAYKSQEKGRTNNLLNGK